MAMPQDMEIDIGVPLLARPANFGKLLELATKGDLVQFRAEMVKYPLDSTAGPDVYNDRTSLHMAALHGQAQIVECIMSSPEISVQVVNASDRFGYTPLHLAVRSKHESIVRILAKSSLMLPDRVLAATSERDELGEDCDGFTPLHLAAAGGSLAIVKLVLQNSIRRGTGNDTLNIHATTWQGLTALDIAKQRNHVELVKVLECFDVNWLELERQKLANSVNAILVGAALVATVAFGCWQQPPLGIPAWNIIFPAKSNILSPQQMYQITAQVQIGYFFICITVSFACSVVSLVVGTAASIPSRGVPLKREVRHLRRSVLRASIFLFLAIFFLMFSFQLSGLLVYFLVTPFETAIHRAGRVVLLALPVFTSAFILRYVVIPKGLLRGNRPVVVICFIMAFGFMIGIAFLLNYLINLDLRRYPNG